MADLTQDIQATPVIRVVLADTRRLMREVLGELLAADPGFRVVLVADLATADPDPERCDVIVRGEQTGRARVLVPEVQLEHAADLAELFRAIRRVCLAPVSAGHTSGVGARTPAGRRELTPRERDVLRAVGSGGSAAQIAAELGISPRTVERHKQSVMAKLGVPNQARAVSRSIELRMFDSAS